MQIVKNTVVSIHYTLRSINEVLIQDTRAYSPEYYLHGAGNILPGLEKALNGKKVGDEVNVVIHPSEAFGPKEEDLVLQLSNVELPDILNLEAGELVLLADGREGVLIEKNSEYSIVDTNHPLAGESLVYQLQVMEVRPATEEEIEIGSPLPVAKACCGATGCC
jgi:FKBP-type peptidyl-prolyl cis-trans isomerase SlyD